MKAANKSSIDKINQQYACVTQSKNDLAAVEAKHGAVENAYGQHLAQFVVATAQLSGLMLLPPAVIQAGIHYLGIAGRDPTMVAVWNSTPGVADALNVSTGAEAEGVKPTRRRSRRAGPGQALVFVEISKREGEKCGLLTIGFRWDGKKNLYGAIVDGREVEGLRSRFPGCVIVDGEDDHVADVPGGGETPESGSLASDPLRILAPSPTNMPKVRSDDPQSGVQSEPHADLTGTPSDLSDPATKPENSSNDVGPPQVANVDSRPPVRPHGASPFNRLATRPGPKGS